MKKKRLDGLRTALLKKADNDRFSVLENCIEGFGMYFLLMWLTFRIIYQADSVTMVEDIVRNGTLVYVAVIGPILHRNPPHELGIDDIKEMEDYLFNRKKHRMHPGATFMAFMSIIVFPMYLNDFDAVLRLVPLFGQLNLYVAAELPWLQLPLAIVEYFIFQFLMVFLLIRKDNLWESIKSLAPGTLTVMTAIFILSFVSADIFRVKGTLLDFLSIWYGYTIWGTLQQLPFLVYFSARFRKGLPHGEASDTINVFLLAFYFAFFHGTQWMLVIFAYLMEIFLAKSYLHEKTRNLFIAGAVHGFLGTVVIFFTGLYIKMDFV